MFGLGFGERCINLVDPVDCHRNLLAKFFSDMRCLAAAEGHKARVPYVGRDKAKSGALGPAFK
jgi:hypothetical protein